MILNKNKIIVVNLTGHDINSSFQNQLDQSKDRFVISPLCF